MSVRRVYVEKKKGFAVAAEELRHEAKHNLGAEGIKAVRILIRYDIENLSEETYRKALYTVFSEPPVDEIYEETFDPQGGQVFSVEYLPGQFDQRADSAEQCAKLLGSDEDPVIRSATTYVIYGDVDETAMTAIKNHCINPVDSRETGEEKPQTLIQQFEEPADIATFDGFTGMAETELKALYDSLGLAMTFRDFLHIQNYFRDEERRDPTVTEIRVLDTYWSDHCRHTTFSTELKNISFADGFYRAPIEDAYREYRESFDRLYRDRNDKYVCLMDIALMAMKRLKAEGKLNDQEESDEINACSIVVPVEVDGKMEEWLVNFKNETHNHPTEIEPFGGAATCLGGAIRDPLSGRTYVYQAMRVTGAADPTVPNSATMPGKLPQKKLVRQAAKGYSSYGNQIGLATGYVKEIYHPDYVAKRMEIGAVMGAAPRRAVQRLTSDPGDVIILLGGRTGRDGIGGATGSSKAHTTKSIDVCGAEVQKGNAPTERKLQRLFRREEVSHIIKKCNDFGAGGVSVAIGELAAGLTVQLDRVPKKYAGLDGTELAISESQERMAVVVDPKDVQQFLSYAAEENLEATEVAVVTEEPRLVLMWRGKKIVDISRAFLDTNGAHQETDVAVSLPDEKENPFTSYALPEAAKAAQAGDTKAALLATLKDLNVCSQKGLVEMFDGSIGAGSVLMPYGGKYQSTETQAMVAKLPVAKGHDCDTVTMMAYGFDPFLSGWSPFHGAVYAVTESIARITAAGGDPTKIRMTYQEYFRRMSEDPARWSQPFAALLGAFSAQIGYGLPSIGGKDSMSGTFNDIDVPPTLVSFAVDVAKEKDILSPELKAPGNKLVLFNFARDRFALPGDGKDRNEGFAKVLDLYKKIHALIQKGYIVSAYALDTKGVFASAAKMAFGQGYGIRFEDLSDDLLFGNNVGAILAEIPKEQYGKLTAEAGDLITPIGEVTEAAAFAVNGKWELSLSEAQDAWEQTLDRVFPSKGTLPEGVTKETVIPSDPYRAAESEIYICKNKTAKPTVFIPVFPGTNCEYDSANAFEKAGAATNTLVFQNLTGEAIRESAEAFAKAVDAAQIIMFPGGFSAGDEPEGSAKFFANVFRHEKVKDAVMRLLNERDGLMLGICNGFQALIKLGLVPYGEILEQKQDSPTLTYNTIGRHISHMVYTKVVSNKSPWLSLAELGKTYVTPASHGEGRFVASAEWIEKLRANGQIATQYADPEGVVSMDPTWNVNGSYASIEGITSPDGRVFGKMAHAERIGRSVAKNIYGEQDMKIFESGVRYYTA